MCVSRLLRLSQKALSISLYLPLSAISSPEPKEYVILLWNCAVCVSSFCCRRWSRCGSIIIALTGTNVARWSSTACLVIHYASHTSTYSVRIFLHASWVKACLSVVAPFYIWYYFEHFRALYLRSWNKLWAPFFHSFRILACHQDPCHVSLLL